jgi:hypothetical protein
MCGWPIAVTSSIGYCQLLSLSKCADSSTRAARPVPDACDGRRSIGFIRIRPSNPAFCIRNPRFRLDTRASLRHLNIWNLNQYRQKGTRHPQNGFYSRKLRGSIIPPFPVSAIPMEWEYYEIAWMSITRSCNNTQTRAGLVGDSGMRLQKIPLCTRGKLVRYTSSMQARDHIE